MRRRYRVLIVGCGRMGTSHARAYQRMSDAFEIAGLVSRGPASRQALNQALGGTYPEFSDYAAALSQTRPDAVCIATYPDTHAEYANAALNVGAHVFLEKPLARSVEEAEFLVAAARRAQRKLVVGYILQVHPSWQYFVDVARGLGKPLVMRMNLNQQLAGSSWDLHQKLLETASPLVDCGVHYVDVMCRMTEARPVRVSGIGARLSTDIAATRMNYGQLQVTFDDGSVGWYEAGWGPMMSETAFFIKDVIGPKGSVSIIARNAAAAGQSSNIDAHTRTESILLHRARLRSDGAFATPDEWIDLADEPDHDELCRREQEFFLRAICDDLDLTTHHQSAIDSLRIVLAAEASCRTGRTVEL